MKKLRKRLIILLSISSILIGISCKSQNIEERILGRWDSKSINVKEFDPVDVDLSMSFHPNKKCDIIEHSVPFKNIIYSIVKRSGKTVLLVGNRKYFIKSITDKELILLEDNIILSGEIRFVKGKK